MDEKRFIEVKNKVMGAQHLMKGIGTLREKTIHAVLKNYYQPDEGFQEIPIEGLVADIFDGREIKEIQTGNFFSLKKKLRVFLRQFPVTVIYPLPKQKWLIWMDPETGELSKRRKSPKQGSVYDAFKELSKISEFLGEENLTVKLVFLDMEEYRLLDGWNDSKKRGSHRYDRLPLCLAEEMEFSCPKDYGQLIPNGMEEPFDTKMFAKKVKIRQNRAAQVLQVLCHLGQVERIGKRGNAYLYRKKG